jgi:plasmid stabilization system protein ParE
VIQLRVSEAAALAIIEQSDYYQQAADGSLASRRGVAVDEATRALSSWPERGAPCRFRSAALANLRWVSVPGFPRHMIFYRYISHEQIILIVHVLHGARNLETLLDQDQE